MMPDVLLAPRARRMPQGSDRFGAWAALLITGHEGRLRVVERTRLRGRGVPLTVGAFYRGDAR
jgi:hypothetical protein